MEILYNRLPKNLVYIIEDFAKDRTNYDKVILQFEQMLIYRIEGTYDDNDFCIEPGRYYQNQCGGCDSFNEMRNEYPECYNKHIDCLNKLVDKGNLFYLKDWNHEEEINELNNIMKHLNWCR